MPARSGSWITALIALICWLTPHGVAQEFPAKLPVDLPAVGGPLDPTASPPTDPLTDLMRRVTNLEEELKKSKSVERGKAALPQKPTVNWMMQVQTDYITNSQSAGNRASVGDIPEGVAFRRARFGMYGDYGPWEYRIAMDFALSGRPSFIDVYGGLNDIPYLGRVRIGHFFEPLGFEQYSQNRFITFMERGLPAEPFAPGRNTGIMANNTWAGNRGTWAAGIFSSESNVWADDTAENFGVAGTGRITFLPWYDEATAGRDLLHLGIAYSARGTRNNQVQFKTRPEIRLGAAEPNIPNFVDTGIIPANFYQLVGTELLLIRGPFSVQAEYILVPVSTTDRGAVYFQVWYVMGSVFLTGENRQYRTSTGTLERIIPRRDFIKREGGTLSLGPGAWELAIRFSHVDLNNGGITGGRLSDMSFGVNWYLNPYFRITSNYIHAYQYATAGRSGPADFWGIRLNYDF